MPNWEQVGAGGILLALWIIREVAGLLVPFIKNVKVKRLTAGELDPEYWKAEMRKAVVESLSPIMETQTQILREMNDNFKVLTKTTLLVEELFRHNVR